MGGKELKFDETGRVKSGFGITQEIKDLVELRLKVLDYTWFTAKDCADNEIVGSIEIDPHKKKKV